MTREGDRAPDLVPAQGGQARPSTTPWASRSARRRRSEADDRDELFDEAVRFVVQSSQASTSMLQRRFRIGFSRAGRLVDMMERDGIVGPADGLEAARDPGGRGLLRDGGQLAEVGPRSRRAAPGRASRRRPGAPVGADARAGASGARRRARRARPTRARRRPLPGSGAGSGCAQGDAAARARASRSGRRSSCASGRVVARYPQSGYCDNALLAIGDLYRGDGPRASDAGYADDAVQAYRVPGRASTRAAAWARRRSSTWSRSRARDGDRKQISAAVRGTWTPSPTRRARPRSRPR